MFQIQHYHKDNKDHIQVSFILDKEEAHSVEVSIPDDSSIEVYCGNIQLALNELVRRIENSN